MLKEMFLDNASVTNYVKLNFLSNLFFQPLKSLIRPKGLKAHQLRPQDNSDVRAADVESSRPLHPAVISNGADATTVTPLTNTKV